MAWDKQVPMSIKWWNTGVIFVTTGHFEPLPRTFPSISVSWDLFFQHVGSNFSENYEWYLFKSLNWSSVTAERVRTDQKDCSESDHFVVQKVSIFLAPKMVQNGVYLSTKSPRNGYLIREVFVTT